MHRKNAGKYIPQVKSKRRIAFSLGNSLPIVLFGDVKENSSLRRRIIE
jgi:hypothetical protein